jgi:DNA polymerase-3 subunit delta'
LFEDFAGNRPVTEALARIVGEGRIPHTLLFHGPPGVGKATLARRLGAALLGGAESIERDDLSLPENRERIAEREKWPAERRSEDPLLFASHPDFVTVPPEGPLRQISIQQMRLLREQAQLRPLRGRRRVFLIDRLDRANEQAANSLLKTLEEPPGHLLLLLTAENVYDLLPTIRSRSVMFHLAPLPAADLVEFVRRRGLDRPERRVALAGGSPGVAVSLDLADFDQRREAMLRLLEAASRAVRFSEWAREAERLALERAEKLADQLAVLYLLLEDVLLLVEGRGGLRNEDIRPRLEKLAANVGFDWVREAVRRIDSLVEFERRNIQRGIALDALVLGLRDHARAGRRA